jgi:hypothetical protein
MAISRTIYSQSQVKLTTGDFGVAQTDFAVISGVQNASVTFNTPRQNVNSFGVRGIIDKVQVEAETATATLSFILPQVTGAGNHLSPVKLNQLMQNSLLDTPTGINVSVAGLGCVYSGVLASVTINAAVGDLPTCELTFEGIPSGGSATQDYDGELPDKITAVSASTYYVLTPDKVSGVVNTQNIVEGGNGNPASNNIGNFGASAQSASFSWEIPVERVLSLGASVNDAAVFTTLPGTSSLTAEGLDMPSGIDGLIVGGYTISVTNAKQVSREHSLAVGEVGATYNVTMESTADSCTITTTA